MSSSSQRPSAATGENPESVERGTRGRMRGVTSRASRGRGRRSRGARSNRGGSRGQEGLDPSEGWKVQREHSSVIHDQEAFITTMVATRTRVYCSTVVERIQTELTAHQLALTRAGHVVLFCGEVLGIRV